MVSPVILRSRPLIQNPPVRSTDLLRAGICELKSDLVGSMFCVVLVSQDVG